MYNLDNLDAQGKQAVKEAFLEDNYTEVGRIFLEKGVTTCAECASNFYAIKQWVSYWINENLI